ncbi:MAG: histidine phosphatase family protein [Polyangiales bacterium]
MWRLDCTVLLFPHVESEPKADWRGDHDLRPLRVEGFERAHTLAREIGSVDAIYSSPALRSAQTVEPLAQVLGLAVIRLEGLREAGATRHQAPWDWWLDQPMQGAIHASAVAGRMLKTLSALASRHRGGRIAVCSHGDAVPIVVACLCTAWELPLPEPCNYGGWYEITEAQVHARGRLLRAG